MTVTLPARPRLMRDAFLDVLYAAATRNRDIYLISPDFGAEALDAFRADLPNQFVHVGICEQNMVDLGAGLALSGKTVFLYAMAPFLTARCYEQIKCSLTSMQLPVTMIAVGVGLGYDHATLTHFTPEDLAAMRALNGIEVVTPADQESATVVAEDAIARPALRYVRLERLVRPHLYQGRFAEVYRRGFAVLAEGRDVWLMGCGYMTHKALAAREALKARGIDAGVIDLFRAKPLDAADLASALGSVRRVVTIEEQMLDGGFGGLVAEAMMDARCPVEMKRLGLRDGFVVVNGSRDHLHALYGVDVPDVVRAVEAW
ncbi:MAG: 1-deoxy-D-xylulose-5-phosphate synthase [Alphaproteobacteria bacterium]